ncbi:YhcN/YlaJ family sporulation lipoprotein [Lentibacillus sediminis]|uniref:YhcN/YlaJ family sporulation lipoprotein n=1 Tax=Lentibacillus sediminis TaxID=1940529 RepID=UPI000C1C55D9|nr:YhcN/YlaJ family sporulation lipoprotein [Lentibacillus sediminis]
MKLQTIMLAVLICSLFIAGCQQEEEPMANDQENNRFLQVKDSDPTEKENLNNTEIASRLANIASDIPGVNDAASVVAGPYTVVGIDVDKDLDRSRVGSIKYAVLEALYHDPYGKTAVVVADGDIMERIRGMGNKINQGYPVQGVVDELAAIVGRYMPDAPVPENQPQEPDQNKEVLPEEEEQQLDDVEDKQSNHHKDDQ